MSRELNRQSPVLLRLVSLATALLSGMVFFNVVLELHSLGAVSLQPKWLLYQGAFAAFTVASLALLALTFHPRFGSWLEERLQKIPSSKWFTAFAILFLVISLGLYPSLIMFYPRLARFIIEKQSTGIHFWLLWISCLGGMLALILGIKNIGIGKSLLAAILGEAVVYKILSFSAAISTFPYALTWEESHRPYAASLLAAERIYGMKIPPYLTDFSLNLVNGIPFLFGSPSILVYRLWTTFLWIGISALTAFLVMRRLKIGSGLIQVLFTGWAFLYLLQEGGIKYNLLLGTCIILIGVSARHPWRSLISVLLASAWAGLSRVNWYPVPVMLGMALYLLEEPRQNYRSAWHYLLKPAVWGILGIGTAVSRQLPDRSLHHRHICLPGG